MQPGFDPPPAKEHHAQEAGLEEKGGQNFIADQGSDYVADHHREAAPVRPELVGQGDPGDHPHCKGHGEDLRPEPGQPVVVVLAGPTPKHQQRGDERRQADGEGRENDVEADGERELQPRQHHSVRIHGDRTSQQRDLERGCGPWQAGRRGCAGPNERCRQCGGTCGPSRGTESIPEWERCPGGPCSLMAHAPSTQDPPKAAIPAGTEAYGGGPGNGQGNFQAG